MCGIAGIWAAGRSQDEAGSLVAQARAMAEAIQHRGPDDHGMWVSANEGLVLTHRRLSILDLSPAGHQPMPSASGRFVMSFNGEIYNHLELREELEAQGAAPAWRGHSDTETFLAALERWGVDGTLKRCAGMFAIALWDAKERALTLVRDRFGEKPLYYGWVRPGHFVFGSELKALRACGGFDNAICREALAQYMRFLYVPAPRTIHRGIWKVEPGCYLRIAARAPAVSPDHPLRPGAVHDGLSVVRWWSVAQGAEDGARTRIRDEGEALSLLETTLTRAVSLQSVADVPLGAFLSGGVDSSTIVALMQHGSLKKVNTFTVGFENAQFDESPHARAVASHLGTAHSELLVTESETRDVIPLLPRMYDEPFADSSQIPTHVVCRAARRHATVAMSGDAGDELFGGYNRYLWGPSLWRWLKLMPYPVRSALGAAVGSVPGAAWDALGRSMHRMLPSRLGVTHPGSKADKLAVRLRGLRSIDDFYKNLVSEWQQPASVVRGKDGPLIEPDSLLEDPPPMAGVEDVRSLMMYRDSVTYLPDDILCKVDRAAMAVSLETRVPFLDHRVAELAWRMPIEMKIRDGQGKWALRQILYKHVPPHLIERPKTGFSIPVGEWLRGPLKSWAEDLLNSERMDRDGYLSPEPIRRRWSEHQSGQRDHTHSLWAVLMFQSWLAHNS